MKIGSSNQKKFGNWFQIRWAEKLGNQNCPYLIRWTFILFGCSIRLHHWIRSDDKRFFHDHSADLLSIVLKGNYKNVNPLNGFEDYPPDYSIIKTENTRLFYHRTYRIRNINVHYVEGIFNSFKNFFNMNESIWFSKATVRHYLDIPKKGAWTLLFEGKKYNKWGFYVPRKGEEKVRKLRPLEYFHRYGIVQDKNYQ